MGGFLAASRRCAVFVALVTGLVGLHASAAFAVAPSNDDIASATTLTATPVTGSNVGATDDSPFGVYKACDPSCNYGGMSVWYRLPNPGKGWLTVNGLTGIANTNFNAQLAVYNGAADSVTDTSGISSDFNSWQRFGTAVTTDPVGLETTAGNDYFIVVDGYSNGVTVPNGTFKFDWTFTPAPANDDFANAATLTTSVATPSTSVSASTTGATQQTNEFGISGTEYDGSTFFNNQGGHSVWYKWTAPGTGQVTVDTHGSSFDTVIAMYTGTTLPTLNQITSSDDSGVADTTSQMTFIAASGATYRIALDGKDDGLGGAAFGAYTLHLNEVIAPANDAFVSAITISGANGTIAGTNAGSSLQTGEPEPFFFFGECNFNDTDSNQPAGKTVWYNWTAPGAGSYSFDTLSNGTYNTSIAAYTGSAVGTLTQVACNDDYSPSTLLSRMVVNATGGQVFRIQVDGADDGTDPTSGTFTLKWRATPANDNFSNATTISGESGSAAPGSSNVGASVEFGEPQNAGVLNGASVWFNWTAPRNGTYFFKTKGSDFNTTLGIYTGSTVSSLTQVASNDDVNGGDNSSYAQFAAVTGTTYHVSVDGFQGASGSIALAWALVPPPNDDFANATLVTGVPGTAAGTNVGATAQTGEPAFLTGGKTVWWKWVATGNTKLAVDTEGSSIDTLLGVYTGSAVTSLTDVGHNDDAILGIDTRSKVTFSATSGTTYYFAVDGKAGATGTLTLNWLVPPVDVTPPTINSFTPADGSYVHGNAVPVTGDATDTGSGVQSMSFTIDDGSVIPPIVATTGPFGGTFDSTLLANGTHTIHVTATDTSLNTTSPQTHTFTVDNAGPTITALTPAQGAFVRGPGIVASADAGDVGSGLASVTFTIDNGAVILPVIDTIAPFGTTFDSRLLTNGAHTVYATATDLGNNTATVAHGITVDNMAPLQPHFTNTLAPFTTATTATVTFADTDATSGIKSYQVQVEKANYNATAFGPWATAPGASALATTSYKLTGLAAGYDYCFRVIATDKAGNVSIASKAACTARLIDDKTAVHSAGWTQGAASTYFGGSASTAKSANRTLTIAGFRGIRLGIMAVQCSTCGAVKIYVGTTLIRTVSLVSAARKDTIILVPVFASRVGTIKIVTTSTKAVTIDGIGASRT